GGMWALFVLIPSIGYRSVARLTLRQKYRAARRLAEVLRFLHPYDGWLEQPRLLRALEHSQPGPFTPPSPPLPHSPPPNPSPPPSPTTRPGCGPAPAITYRRSRRWEGLLERVAHLPDPAIAEALTLATVTLRALGEVGDLTSLIQMFERLQRPLPGTAAASV